MLSESCSGHRPFLSLFHYTIGTGFVLNPRAGGLALQPVHACMHWHWLSLPDTAKVTARRWKRNAQRSKWAVCLVSSPAFIPRASTGRPKESGRNDSAVHCSDSVSRLLLPRDLEDRKPPTAREPMTALITSFLSSSLAETPPTSIPSPSFLPPHMTCSSAQSCSAMLRCACGKTPSPCATASPRGM